MGVRSGLLSSARRVLGLAVRTGDRAVLGRSEWFTIAAIVSFGAISLLVEGIGAFALIATLIGRDRHALSLGALLVLPDVGLLAYAPPASVLLAVVLAQRMVSPFLFFLANRVGERVAYRLRARILELATSLPAIHAGAIPSGEIASVLSEEVSRCGRSVTATITALQLFLGVSVTAAVMLLRVPSVTLAATLAALPALAIYFASAGRTSSDTGRAVRARIQAQAKSTEALRTLGPIQAVGGASKVLRQLLDHVAEIRDAETRIYRNVMRLQYSILLVPVAAGLGALAEGYHAYPGATLSDVIAALAPVAGVGLRLALAVATAVSSTYGINVMSTSLDPTLALEARLEALGVRARAHVEERLLVLRPERITLRGVGFQLSTGAWLVRNLDTTIVHGVPLIVRGPSGAGKSTLVSLIAGLNEPTEGEIVFAFSGGEQSPPHPSLINYLSQEPAVIVGSVRDNLMLGAADAPGDAGLVEALKAARLWEEMAVKGGLDAPILEGGRNLSGGQIRRLGIARLFARRRRIWMFDEPTASVDAESARIIVDTIREFADDNIVIVVTHVAELNLPGNVLELSAQAANDHALTMRGRT